MLDPTATLYGVTTQKTLNLEYFLFTEVNIGFSQRILLDGVSEVCNHAQALTHLAICICKNTALYFFSSPLHPEWLWGPRSGYQELLTWG
jgi:hypothetical protein